MGLRPHSGPLLTLRPDTISCTCSPTPAIRVIPRSTPQYSLMAHATSMCDVVLVCRLKGSFSQRAVDMSHRHGADLPRRYFPPNGSAAGGTERRRNPRDTASGEPSRMRLVTMIEATYREMPGLSLSLNQAARLFGLRERTCHVLLDDLVRDGRLRRAADGQYRAP
jgi:hypothetical protein